MITLEQVNKDIVLTKENINLIIVTEETPKKDITLRNKLIKKLEVLYECRNLLETNPNATYLEQERLRLNNKVQKIMLLLPTELIGIDDLEEIKNIKRDLIRNTNSR